jgi:hypothetical protein
VLVAEREKREEGKESEGGKKEKERRKEGQGGSKGRKEGKEEERKKVMCSEVAS